jgi:hypothetical protein
MDEDQKPRQSMDMSAIARGNASALWIATATLTDI